MNIDALRKAIKRKIEHKTALKENNQVYILNVLKKVLEEYARIIRDIEDSDD